MPRWTPSNGCSYGRPSTWAHVLDPHLTLTLSNLIERSKNITNTGLHQSHDTTASPLRLTTKMADRHTRTPASWIPSWPGPEGEALLRYRWERPPLQRPTCTPETTDPWIPPWPGTRGQGADPDTAFTSCQFLPLFLDFFVQFNQLATVDIWICKEPKYGAYWRNQVVLNVF